MLDAPEVPGLPRLDHVGQRLERLLDGRLDVEPVNLVQVHVVGAQAAERIVDRAHDVRPRQPGAHEARVPSGSRPWSRSRPRRAAPGRARPVPVTSSLTPFEYMSAVSKKLMPCSSARTKNGRLSASDFTQERQRGIAERHASQADARDRQVAVTEADEVHPAILPSGHPPRARWGTAAPGRGRRRTRPEAPTCSRPRRLSGLPTIMTRWLRSASARGRRAPGCCRGRGGRPSQDLRSRRR